MSFDIVKFERGQVWIIRWRNPTYAGHEQQKDRPWLILSVGKYNLSSGMITAVPITTRNGISSPAQVMFENNQRGCNNVILCEQVRSFDTKCGEYTFDYMGSLSNEILEKVDVALSIHLGLHYSPITLKSLYDSMEAIVKSIAYVEQQNTTDKFTDDDVLDFAQKLQDLVQPATRVTNTGTNHGENSVQLTTDSEPSNRQNTKRIDTTSSNNRISTSSSKSSADITGSSRKGKRIKWTKEICESFLQDANDLPMKEVMKKWDISEKTRYYSMKNYALNLLEKMD